MFDVFGREMNKVFLFIFALLLAGCNIQEVDIRQDTASGLAGELLDGQTFGQTFRLRHNNLNRVDLYTATYARENTQPVIFRICSSPACDGTGGVEERVHLELPAARISNSGPTVITFQPIAGTAGQTLYFSIESPGSVVGNAITIYRNEKDVYPDGQMYVDGQPADGDLAFIAYTQEKFTLADIWKDFYSRASQDKPFFTFYCSLLAMLLLALIITFIWPSHKLKIDKERGTGDNPAAPSDPMSENEE
jgi:hypothetical protein